MRACRKCLIEKPLEEFFKDPRGLLGRTHLCKPCTHQRRLEGKARKKAGLPPRRSGRKPVSLAARFSEKVSPEPNSGCWLWLGSLDEHGYGKIGTGPKNAGWLKASRVAWEIHRGTIPDGLAVCHRCDNPSCVNPAHLFLGTQTANMGDCARKGRIGTSKLTPEHVRAVRAIRAAGFGTQSELAEMFRVSPVTILNVLSGRTWSHVA